VPLTGLVLSKFDADTRGGAALSFQRVTKVPIRFLGTGEGIDALELFQPERLVGRLLGMGDIVGLVEKAQAEFDVPPPKNWAKAGEEFLRPPGLPRPDQNGAQARPAAKCAWHDPWNA
jgi:signal recognition particle GTPase